MSFFSVFLHSYRQAAPPAISIGVPPHRYHNIRRIEHAKSLLMKPACSVTEIGLSVGFSETSSFTAAAFRKATGSTRTSYRRSLA